MLNFKKFKFNSLHTKIAKLRIKISKLRIKISKHYMTDFILTEVLNVYLIKFYFTKILNIYLVRYAFNKIKYIFTKISGVYFARPAVFAYVFFYIAGIVTYSHTYDMCLWDSVFKKNYLFMRDFMVYWYQYSFSFAIDTYVYLDFTIRNFIGYYIGYPEPIKIKPVEIENDCDKMATIVGVSLICLGIGLFVIGYRM